jgi:hypothetical protein
MIIMMKKKTTLVAIVIVSYLLVHGIAYILCPLAFGNIWDGLYSFIFGNATLSSTFFLLPLLFGIMYIMTAIGILLGSHWSRVLLWLLCILAVFLEFPIGALISIMIFIYTLRPSFSRILSSKINKKHFQMIGISIILAGVASFLIVSGFASGVINFTSYSISGFSLSSDDPESKIIDIQQRVGVMDVLIELTGGIDYANEQQSILLSEIPQYIIEVKQQFVQASNAVIVTVEASTLLSIAENSNIAKIYSINPSFQFLPEELMSAEPATYAPLQLNVKELWNRGITGKGITIAIMDTGIKEDHPSLQRDGKSIVVGGLRLHGMYVQEHGTMVASCIANQNETYKGIAPGVNLLNIEVFQWRTVGGVRYLSATNADILQGFEYIANWKKITGDYIILSCSWGVSAQAWSHDANVCTESANRLAVEYNIPVIAAAGNSGPKAQPYTPVPFQIMAPGGAKNVLAVGAVDYSNTIASFSSRGPYFLGNDKPDVVAPGVNVPVLDYQGITTASGTSFACPYVSGIAALIAQEHQGLSSNQLYSAIRNGATDLGTSGYDYEYGYGLANAENSMKFVEQTPSTNNIIFMIALLVAMGVAILFYPNINKKLR